MKRKALGKGLSALLPYPDVPPPAEAGLEVPLESLEPNPYQPRGTIAPEALAELAASIQESGMVQPILVRRAGPRFQIIAGERRWRAARRLGLATVPVTFQVLLVARDASGRLLDQRGVATGAGRTSFETTLDGLLTGTRYTVTAKATDG